MYIYNLLIIVFNIVIFIYVYIYICSDESNSSGNFIFNGFLSFEDFDSMIFLGLKFYFFEFEVSFDEELIIFKKFIYEMDDKER